PKPAHSSEQELQEAVVVAGNEKAYSGASFLEREVSRARANGAHRSTEAEEAAYRTLVHVLVDETERALLTDHRYPELAIRVVVGNKEGRRASPEPVCGLDLPLPIEGAKGSNYFSGGRGALVVDFVDLRLGVLTAVGVPRHALRPNGSALG